jgi:hypothetical protein
MLEEVEVPILEEVEVPILEEVEVPILEEVEEWGKRWVLHPEFEE